MRACELVLEQAVVVLPQANLWMLAAVARATYWLQYPMPAEQQRRFTEAFLALMQRHAASLGKARASCDGSGGTVQPAHSSLQQPAADGLDSGITQGFTNFIWAVFSNQSWILTPEQRAAMMGYARLPGAWTSQHNANILMALVRLDSFEGAGAVALFLEDGMAQLLIDRNCALLEGLNAQQCKDTLLR